MSDKNKKDQKIIKKKSNKPFRDDDAYDANRIKKEFKRKKQSLKEDEDDWENWSNFYNK